MLLSPESEKSLGFIQDAMRKFEQRKFARLATPSVDHLFEVFDILRKRETSLRIGIGDDQLHISRIQIRHTSSVSAPYETFGTRVAIRQKLPEVREDANTFLSISMTQEGIGDIQLASCVVQPIPYGGRIDLHGEYRRTGDLRFDTITKRGSFIEGAVDGNDQAFGLPTGEGFIDGISLDRGLSRGYLMLVKNLFDVGEVPPYGNDQDLPHILL